MKVTKLRRHVVQITPFEAAAAIVITCLIIPLLQYEPNNAFAQSVNDPSLGVESFVEGLNSPTSMAFLDNDNILILEKEGQVRLVSNGELAPEPVLQIPVDTDSERGLLGIAVMNGTSSSSSGTGSGSGQNASAQTVFLYYTESGGDGGELRNRVYKYSWNGQTLDNPTLLVDLPAIPGPNHDGGKLMIGPDNYLYGIIGDLNHDGKLQNFPDGPDPDDTGIIFRVNPNDGTPAPDNPLSTDPNNPLSKYYAYGIRNSFGLTFDPVTNNVWDTENGPASNDEINVVKPGFNSGWQTIMGPISASGSTEDELVSFPGSHYADPLLTWLEPNAVTDIEFLESSSLGESYSNNVFVGDNNFGNLYYFRVNPDRSALVLDNIPDLLIDNEQEQTSITFGNGFGAITDLETGPDGYLYVMSYDAGTIYRIVPSSVASSSLSAGTEEAGTPMSPVDEQEQDGQDDEDEEESASDDDENGDGENN
jgi:glucose/arabinose dehydrogenase